MTAKPQATHPHAARQAPGRAVVIVAAALVLMLAGCGDRKKDKATTQTAARVNKEEITVHQINFVLQQQRALPPAQAASASRQVLSRLIDQELAVQKAQEQKLDRDPRVVQQIEAAKREIIARAYAERIGSGVSKPGADEIKKYYDEKPALFSERRIYNLQELNIEATPDQLETLRANLQSAKDANAFVEYLKSAGFKFAGKQAVTPAEQLPLASLDAFARLKDGQAMFNATPTGAQVVVLAGSRTQPVDAARAQPAIEQFLLNERKRKAIQDDLAALRAEAKIEYVGEFALDAAAAAEAATAATAVVETRSPMVAPAASMPVSEPVHLPIGASAPSSAALEKGVKGLK